MLNFFASWLFPKPKDVVAANPMPDINHDVFVSFRGEDIRDNFLGHLVAAFDRKHIKHFVDDELVRGEEVWPSIVGAIEESFISLIIFSENYATSRWCLQELVHILECRKKYKQKTAIPIFYRVDPRDVRYQTGSYENALAEHGKKYNSTKVQSWRDALKESADLSGITSSNCRNDAVLIDEIVSHVLTRLRSSKNSVNSKGLIGIEKQIAHVESLINKKLEGTRFIRIWGIGGIGKTTIAEEIFKKHKLNRSEYGGYCFLGNVREELAKYGKVFLKEKLFSELLGEKVKLDTSNGLPDHVERRVKRMKVLIVLDDADDSDQLKILVGDGDWFRSGSTVIITTRNKQVVPAEDDYIHEVGALDFDEALELFNLNAFKQDHLKMEYCELSEKVVNYAKGIPLVLKVLGHLLCGNDKEIWESQLNKLEKMPPKKVYESLKLSYDDLDRIEQRIFLDLACFFVGLNLKVEYIKTLLKEGENDNSVAVGLKRLKDRALITFSEGGYGVSMHDIIREMAWEIVFHECPEDPGRRSRLGDPDDVYQVLQNDKGSKAIKSIKVPLTAVSNLKLSPHVFAKMSKLQFLHVLSEYVKKDEMDLLPQGLQSLPTELRYLVWKHYPLKSLPEKFSAEKLVILDLLGSKLEKLWQGVQKLVNLKEVNLSYSLFLKELPDFSKATNLELLNIVYCRKLTNVHPSIFSLEKLDILNLSNCTSLSEFSVTISENMRVLILESTRVIALAASFGSQSKLERLHLNGCCYIESLPSCFNKFTNLTFLSVNGCKELKTLPELPSSLEILYARDCTSLETISFPSIVEQFRENRRMVQFWDCLKLDERSLVAIGLNVQINMMKYACQHLPAAHDDSFDTEDGFYAEYVYPGSSVPEWFVYTTEDYIVIDLSAPNSPILGFIFCFVLRELPCPTYLIFNITIYDDEGEGKGNTFGMLISNSNIDQVCVIYNERISRFLISRARNLRRLKIKVVVEDQIRRHVEMMELLRGFGVYPINTTPHHDFIQKME